MGVAEFFCNFCFSIHYIVVRFVDVYAYITGCMSCARIFDTSIPRSKNPTITEDVMESTVKKESISRSPTRQRLREKNYPRRTYNSFHVWGYAFKQKKHTHRPNSSCWVAERPSLVPNIVRLRLQAHHPQKLPVKKQPLIWMRLWDG